VPYTHWWEVDKHVLYVSYSGEITADELLTAMKELEANGGPFVNIISDVTNVSRQPALPEIMTVMRQFERSEHMGWSINVGDSHGILRFTTNIAGQYLGQRMRSFDTVEEAMAFLREVDPSIEWDAEDR
jgi:hypothetical protein